MKLFLSRRKSTCIYIFILIFLSSCATSQKSALENEIIIAVNSLIVMPVHINQGTLELGSKSTDHLHEGSQVLTNILQDLLSEKNTTFLSANEVESLVGDFNGSPKAVALQTARQLGGDAVLLTSLNRYQERDGNQHSINEPASVSLQYDLVHVESGKNLCFGFFEETQQPLFSDLFSINKAYKRKFKWVNAETIAREGLEEKFRKCPQLSK